MILTVIKRRLLYDRGESFVLLWLVIMMYIICLAFYFQLQCSITGMGSLYNNEECIVEI
jgi:hypothetical protein